MSSQPIVRAENVVKTFGEVRALDGVSLGVEPGEILAVAGVDGNGQWELFEVLVGLRRPQSGSVQVDGRTING